MMDDQKILGCNFDSRAKSILAASCNSWTQEAWRSLADIKELVELRKANAELKKTIKELTDGVTHLNRSRGDISPLLEAYTKALKAGN
jgi:cell division protein FtsB